MTYSILVVDDDDDDFMLLAHHVKQCHQHVSLTRARNGKDAIRQLTDGLQANLILVDAQMPVMNGYEFLVWTTKSDIWRQIPIVMWTGDVPVSEVTLYYQTGANSVMLKEDVLRDIDAFCHHWFKMVQLPQLVLGDYQ